VTFDKASFLPGLVYNHIYVVRAEDNKALFVTLGSLIWVHGHPYGYSSERFEIVNPTTITELERIVYGL
jgi:hypothetical protein